MSWDQSLIKLSSYQVEVLQKRLGEIVERRMGVEAEIRRLEEEGLAEALHARDDAEAGWFQLGFLAGLRTRKAQAQEALALILAEEAGARDALAGAFEDQKKYEHVAETIRLTAVRATARREAAVLDEMGLRRAGVQG